MFGRWGGFVGWIGLCVDFGDVLVIWLVLCCGVYLLVMISWLLIDFMFLMVLVMFLVLFLFVCVVILLVSCI